jgi:hypothetical protein
MKIFKYFGLPLLWVIWFLGIHSCSKMDDYKKFLDGKETLYTGKVDSVKVYPGRNRIKLSWLLISDPKVTKVKVYWNSRLDSVEMAVTKTAHIDTINLIIPNLTEGTYNFEIFTYDQDGNSSIVVNKSGRVYGSSYEEALINRQISTVNWQVGGSTFITWGTTDSSSLGVELKYTDNSNISYELFVSNKTKVTELIDFNSTTSIEYRTMFQPDSECIDTFYASSQTKSLDGILLKNSGPSINYKAGTLSGRYADLADWIFNSTIQNHASPFVRGGFDTENGNCIAMEGWGSSTQITNGKIYQTLSLPAGSYKFVVTVANIDGNLATDNTTTAVYITVAVGDALPDITDISSALAMLQLSNVKGDLTVPFELTEVTKISLGFLATIKRDAAQGVRISKVQLLKN